MLHAALKSKTPVETAHTYCFANGRSVFTFLASTATRKVSFVVVSSQPKTHCLSASSPTFCSLRANNDVSASTIRPSSLDVSRNIQLKFGRLARMSVLDTEVDGSNPGSCMLFP